MPETMTRPPTKRVLLDHDAVDEVRALVRDGWVDRLVIRDRAGREVIVMPVLVGVAAAVLAPVWMALGALAGAALGCTIDIELRDVPAPQEWPFEPPPDVDEGPPRH